MSTNTYVWVTRLLFGTAAAIVFFYEGLSTLGWIRGALLVAITLAGVMAYFYRHVWSQTRKRKSTFDLPPIPLGVVVGVRRGVPVVTICAAYGGYARALDGVSSQGAYEAALQSFMMGEAQATYGFIMIGEAQATYGFMWDPSEERVVYGRKTSRSKEKRLTSQPECLVPIHVHG